MTGIIIALIVAAVLLMCSGALFRSDDGDSVSVGILVLVIGGIVLVIASVFLHMERNWLLYYTNMPKGTVLQVAGYGKIGEKSWVVLIDSKGELVAYDMTGTYPQFSGNKFPTVIQVAENIDGSKLFLLPYPRESASWANTSPPDSSTKK